MRASGSLAEVPAAGTADHLCWVHGGDDDATFDAAVHAFLTGGLARGERLLCVGERAIAAARAEPAPIGDLDALTADGTLELMTVAQAYAATGAFSAERQFAFYDAATRRARAEGYAGLRVVAELSSLAADPLQREELVRWERLADRYIVQGPGLTALCAYRADLLPDAVADVASVHPAVHATADMPPFRVYFDVDPDGAGDRVDVAGSVDLSGADRLARLLADSPDAPAVLLDVSRLEFVDVAGCRAVARWVAALRERGVPVEIRGESRLFRRIWRVLDEVPPSSGS